MDRDQAYAKMEAFVMECLVDEDEDAYEEFWSPFSDDDRDNLDSSWQLLSDDIYDMWFYFDRPIEDGRSVARSQTFFWNRIRLLPRKNAIICKSPRAFRFDSTIFWIWYPARRSHCVTFSMALL